MKDRESILVIMMMVNRISARPEWLCVSMFLLLLIARYDNRPGGGKSSTSS